MNTIATVPLSALKRRAPPAQPRWRVDEIETLFALPLMDLLYRAQQVHREHFDANEIQLSTLLSIKTGAVPKIAATVRSRRTSTPVWPPAR